MVLLVALLARLLVCYVATPKHKVFESVLDDVHTSYDLSTEYWHFSAETKISMQSLLRAVV